MCVWTQNKGSLTHWLARLYDGLRCDCVVVWGVPGLGASLALLAPRLALLLILLRNLLLLLGGSHRQRVLAQDSTATRLSYMLRTLSVCDTDICRQFYVLTQDPTGTQIVIHAPDTVTLTILQTTFTKHGCLESELWFDSFGNVKPSTSLNCHILCILRSSYCCQTTARTPSTFILHTLYVEFYALVCKTFWMI